MRPVRALRPLPTAPGPFDSGPRPQGPTVADAEARVWPSALTVAVRVCLAAPVYPPRPGLPPHLAAMAQRFERVTWGAHGYGPRPLPPPPPSVVALDFEARPDVTVLAVRATDGSPREVVVIDPAPPREGVARGAEARERSADRAALFAALYGRALTAERLPRHYRPHDSAVDFPLTDEAHPWPEAFPAPKPGKGKP